MTTPLLPPAPPPDGKAPKRPRVRNRAAGHAIHATTSKKKPKPADGMTDIERAYARHLDGRKSRGEIKDYDHHSIRLKYIDEVPAVHAPDGSLVAKAIPASWYTPDFVVVELDDSWSFHETKGFHLDNNFGWLAFKACASRHPFPAYFVTLEGGRWRTEAGVKHLVAGEWIITRYAR